MKGTRGSGGKRVVRVNTSLSNKDSFKLNRLATACQLPPATLAAILINKGLNNAEWVRELQDEYCLYSAYKVIPIKGYEKDELDYALEETRRNDI